MRQVGVGGGALLGGVIPFFVVPFQLIGKRIVVA